jgi:hypothetical protein
MTTPNKCGVCYQPFESDRDLQEHQESAHPAKQGDKPQAEGWYGERQSERENIA